MKSQIFITTYHSSSNYGSNLQSYALAKTLTDMQYEVAFVGKFRVLKFFLSHPMLLYARLQNKLNKQKTTAFFSPVPYFISEKRQKRLNSFFSENFNEKSFLNSSEWNLLIRNKPVFIAGSDIIWNPARGYPAKFFLDFAYYAGLDRFSYASSVGALELPEKYHKAYKRYLGSMKGIGVREQSVADMLEPIVGKKVTKVVDPTLLLTVDDWAGFSLNAELSVQAKENEYILCYFVMNDPRYWNYVKKMKEATGLQVIVLPMHELDEQQPYDIVLDGTPYEFVWLIKNAAFVCTDSFHACVISSIFEKDFYLLRRARKAEDEKYRDFLTRYRLMDRIVTDENCFQQKEKTDYEYFRTQIIQDRAESLNYLTETLNKYK